MKQKFILIALFFISLFFQSCSLFRNLFNIEKELKGKVTFCNETEIPFSYTVEIEGKSQEFSSSDFSMKIPYKKNFDVRFLITESSYVYSNKIVKNVIDFNPKNTIPYPFDLSTSRKLRLNIYVHSLKNTFPIVISSSFLSKPKNVNSDTTTLPVTNCQNNFQLNFELSETKDFKKLDTAVFINNFGSSKNVFNIVLKPDLKQMDSAIYLLNEIDKNLKYAKKKIETLKNLRDKMDEGFQKDKLNDFIVSREKELENIENEFNQIAPQLEPIKEKMKTGAIKPSDISSLTNMTIKLQQFNDDVNEIYNTSCNIYDEIKGMYKIEFEGKATYPTGKYLFSDIYNDAKDSFNIFCQNLLSNINDKYPDKKASELYFVIQIDCSADGQYVDENAFLKEYKSIVSSDGYISKYKTYPINKTSVDSGNLRLAFLRAYYLLEEVNKKFPNYNYYVKFYNYGSSLAPDNSDNPEYRYSKYSIIVHTAESFNLLKYE